MNIVFSDATTLGFFEAQVGNLTLQPMALRSRPRQ